ncbi:hypothetical protein F2Q69_00047953 [Brassica cretica]|uniref:Uncharacterized protein n=1 Tax=Brassica cretica TaxID=69181 RepID=A0A8S9PR46_BRACR|nr:hypothetical protein F2Q69_00047953 [Brassica cretica]
MPASFLHFCARATDLAPSWSLPFSRDVDGVLVQSGCVTSLHKVAPGHSGYLTLLRSPAPDHARIATKCRAG